MIWRATTVLVLGFVASCTAIDRGVEQAEPGLVIDNYHGNLVEDPYRWLEDLDAERTAAFIEQHNSETAEFLEPYSSVQDEAADLAADLARLRSDTTRVEAGFLLEQERNGDSDLPLVLFGRPGSVLRTLIDPDQLGLDPSGSIRYVRPSPDGRYVVFGYAPAGQRLMTLHVAEVEPQRLLPERIEGVKFSAASWAANSREFVYSKYASPGTLDGSTVDRGSMLAVHRVGQPVTHDYVVRAAEATDAYVFLSGEVSDDGRLLLVWDWSSEQRGSELIVADLGDPMKPVWDAPLESTSDGRVGNHRYIGGAGREIFLQTTRDAANQRIVRLDLDQPRAWKTVVAEEDRPLQHSAYADGQLVLAYRRDVLSELEVLDVGDQTRRTIELPSPGSVFTFRRGPDPGSVSFQFDSFTQPPTGYQLQPRSAELRPLGRARSALQGFVTKQFFATSEDGTRIPYFVIGDEAQLTDEGPLLLYGYGASRHILEPQFDPEWATWLRLGGKLAMANVRGGGEYGEQWHRAGALENKHNSFSDFIAVAEELIADGFTSRDQLVAYGTSNGGLLVTAAMVQRPDLFGAVLADVGVYDALRFPLFTAGPRWAGEMGDSRKEEEYRWVREWSPLHNLSEGTCYPATLLTTARDDDLVHPSQSYKFAAALRDVQGCLKPVLLRVYQTGGHGTWDAHSLLARGAADRLTFAAIATGLVQNTGKSRR